MRSTNKYYKIKKYTDGLYATNDSEINPRPSGGNNGNRDPKANGGYARGNTPQFKNIIWL